MASCAGCRPERELSSGFRLAGRESSGSRCPERSFRSRCRVTGSRSLSPTRPGESRSKPRFPSSSGASPSNSLACGPGSFCGRQERKDGRGPGIPGADSSASVRAESRRRVRAPDQGRPGRIALGDRRHPRRSIEDSRRRSARGRQGEPGPRRSAAPVARSSRRGDRVRWVERREDRSCPRAVAVPDSRLTRQGASSPTVAFSRAWQCRHGDDSEDSGQPAAFCEVEGQA
jgi:hypothetical protein